MFDIDVLKHSNLPIDSLIQSFRADLKACQHVKFHKFHNFTSYVTLSLVSDSNVVRAAKNYIVELIRDKEKYGILYLLNTKKLVVPLHPTFNSELVVDPDHFNEIVSKIDEVAKDFSCPQKTSQFYEITRIELLYFFTLLVNTHLNWIMLDHILRCNRTHDYLIAAPSRLLLTE